LLSGTGRLRAAGNIGPRKTSRNVVDSGIGWAYIGSIDGATAQADGTGRFHRHPGRMAREIGTGLLFCGSSHRLMLLFDK
jgi:hypothetical protein